jgi:aminopeptidase N
VLRPRIIRALGNLGDDDILHEARRRFDEFLTNPSSLRPGLREVVAQLAGRGADQRTYDALLALARRATDATERSRYYYAAAGALDPVLAKRTLALTLTDELPTTFVGSMISTVAWGGEQPELALDFVLKNFSALSAKQGPSFRDYFVANLMTVFSEASRVAELEQFAPVQATSGGRIVAERAKEAIMGAANFRAHTLPAVDDWIKQAGVRP